MARRSSTNNYNPKLSELVVDGNTTDLCWEYILTLSKVVVYKCFSKYIEHFDKDDLVSLAVADAISFIKKVATLQKDGDINSIRNVLFTRIRNTLSNFIFKSNKLISTEDDVLNSQVTNSSNETHSDLINAYELSIDSIESFRSVSLKTWQLFTNNGANQKYTINDDTNNIEDWETYSEVKNMKSPCSLIAEFNNYTEDEIETLANKLDNITGQNYFNILYQLLGDKFLAFLDVFQEDKFSIPSTTLVKRILTDMSICDDYSSGLSIDDLAYKYSKSSAAIQKIIDSREVI